MAASTIRQWTASADEVTWTLDAPAEPLTVFSQSGAVVALWLDGVKLTGPPLTFAAWSTPAINANGFWVGRNLPPKPLRLLLLPRAAFASNAHDAVARQISYPWPARVEAPVQ